MFKIEHNVETGEIIEIPLTEGEIKEALKMQELAIKNHSEFEAEVALREAKKQEVLDKLGLTADEVAALLA